MNQAQGSARVEVAVRSPRGGGLLTFVLELDAEAAAKLKVGEVKRLLCGPPHNLCRGASSLVLVLNGAILRDDTALLDAPSCSLGVGQRGSRITAVILNSPSPSPTPSSTSPSLNSFEPTSACNQELSGVDQGSTSESCASEAHAHISLHTRAAAAATDIFSELSALEQATLLLNPELKGAYKFWKAVEQFYCNHVAGDGRIDHSRLPCGVTELHLKYFAMMEHLVWPQLHSKDMQQQFDLEKDAVAAAVVQSYSKISFISMSYFVSADGSLEVFEHSDAVSNFRNTRLSVFGLSNATWLNGAEGMPFLKPSEVSKASPDKAYLLLYWPPDAVKKNGGKTATFHHYNIGRVLEDLKYSFERFPQQFASTFALTIDSYKARDSMCKVFLSIVDFNRLPHWLTPETLERLHRQLPLAERAYFERALRASPQLCKRLEKEINSCNLLWGCWLDGFPELQLEVARAISCLSDLEADAHVKALLQAEDLLPLSSSSSDTHMINKFDLDLNFFAEIASKLVGSLAAPKRSHETLKYLPREHQEKIMEVLAKIRSFAVALTEGKDAFVSETNQRISKLLEVFLFFILVDKKEMLQAISTQNFFTGVNEQSGGNFLLHLLSVFAWKYIQEFSFPDRAHSWDGFKARVPKNAFGLHFDVLSQLPVALAVVLHRNIHAHLSSCSCLKDGIWFPCDWPQHIKTHLLSSRLFKNLDSNPRLRRLFGCHSLFFELKPRILAKPIDSIVLIKFAWKLWSSDLSACCARDAVDKGTVLALEEDLKRDSLGRATLAADGDAAAVIVSCFEASELDDICRYIHIRNQCLDDVPVRIRGLQDQVWMNGAEGVSDLSIGVNGRCRVHVRSPAHVAESCKGSASISIDKLEILGHSLSASFFASNMFIARSMNVDVAQCLKFIFQVLPKLAFSAVQKHPDNTSGSRLNDCLTEFGPFMESAMKKQEDAGRDDSDAGFVDLLMGLVGNLPFISTIKHLMLQLIGSIGFWVRLFNPSTRIETLECLRIQVRVLTAFDLPGDVLDAIDRFFDSDIARKILQSAQNDQAPPDHLHQQPSVLEMFMKFGGCHESQRTQHDGSARNKFAADVDESFAAVVGADSSFKNSILQLYAKSIDMQKLHQQFKQSGLPDSLAQAASFDRVIAGDPELQSFFEKDGLGLSKMIKSLESSHVDDNARVTDTIDGLQLATEQRVTIAPDVIPSFLAGAEGIVLGPSTGEYEAYNVLIKKPAAAVFSCQGSCVRKVSQQHLKLLGKPLQRISASTDWIDEDDCVRKKHTDYGLMCPKSHALRLVAPAQIDVRVNFCSICGLDLSSDARSCCEGGCVYSVCAACLKNFQCPALSAPPAMPSDDDAYIHGIKISALQKFKEQWQCTYKSMTTSQFVNMILRPRTVVHKMSYVNILRQEAATRDDVGIANWFVSHSWKATFADTVNSILYFFQTQSPHDNDAVIWLDVFCDCQHRTGASTKEASWYMTTFRSAISKMGNLLLSIDDWRDPKPLERAWCILELHAISQKIREGGGRFEITMPSQSRDSFLQATSSRYDNYFMLLSNVDAEHSFCSRSEDQANIHKSVVDTIGFNALNRSIYSVISQWIIDQIKAHTAAIQEKNPIASIPRMKDLGMILNEMGRYEEALQVLQDASQMFGQYGSVAPQSFGTSCQSLDAQIDRQIVRIYVHLGQYDVAQIHHNSLIARCVSSLQQLHCPGSNLQEFLAEEDRVHTSSVRERLATSMQKLSVQHPEHSQLLKQYSTNMRSGSGTLSNSYEYIRTQLHMSFYNLLLCEDAEDPEYLKACGSVNDNDLVLLEDALSDPLSNIKLKKTAFDIKSSRLPSAHPAVALAALRLAHAYIDGDQCDLALPLLQFCLPLFRRLPPLHSNTALALLLRSACLFKNGDMAAASSDLAEALSMCKDVRAGRMAIPAELQSLAESTVQLFQCERVTPLMVNSEGNKQVDDVNDSACHVVSRLIMTIIKKIGCEDAHMKKVIINNGRDPETHHMAELIVQCQRASRTMLRSLRVDADGKATSATQNDTYVAVAFRLSAL